MPVGMGAAERCSFDEFPFARFHVVRCAFCVKNFGQTHGVYPMKRLPMTMYVGLFVAAMAAPSFAADLPRPSYKAPIYSVPGYNWTGFYAGINGGYGFGKSDWSGPGGTGSTSPKGPLAGVTLGYNLQTGSWVWGLEGDVDYSWVKGSAVGTGLACGGVGCETKNSWLATARGRLGYAGWDRWLPYITGGLAYGQVKMTPAAVSYTHLTLPT